MTHKVLLQLESDIEAKAQESLKKANATGKPLLDTSAVMAWDLCLDKLYSQSHELTAEQLLEIEIAKQTNMKKD